jgi:hypothetical protein
MATATIADYRRTDQRCNALENPYWITSAIVDGAAVSGLKDKACILFSFPVAGQRIILHDFALEIITGFTATTVMEVGSYTLATSDAMTTGELATLVEADEYLAHGDITATAAAWYYADAGSHFLTAKAAGTHVNPANLIIGAATVVPCIAITATTPTIIIGQAQLHVLISIIPGT